MMPGWLLVGGLPDVSRSRLSHHCRLLETMAALIAFRWLAWAAIRAVCWLALAWPTLIELHTRLPPPLTRTRATIDATPRARTESPRIWLTARLMSARPALPRLRSRRRRRR